MASRERVASLQQVQMSIESGWGTAVAPTLNLIEFQEFKITPDVEVESVRGMGSIAPSTAAVISSVSGMASGKFNLNLERIHYFLDSLLGTALAAGGADPYTRTYTPSINTNPTRASATLVHGDSAGAVSLVGAVVSSLTFNIKRGFISVDVEWVGKNAETDSIATIVLPTTTYLKGSQCVVSIASLGGSFTDLDCDALDMVIKINTNTTVRHGLGSIEACDYNIGDFDASVDLMVEYENATAKAIKTALLGTSPSIPKREVKATITSGSHSLTMTMICHMIEAGEFYEDTDGVVSADLKFEGRYDPSANLTTSFFQAVLVNGVS